MKIASLMTPDPLTCLPSTNAAEAAALMLQGDCGILPVVENGKLIGVATDRDLFIALATRKVRASDLKVGDVPTGTAYTCAPDDDVAAVLEVMKQHTVRRMPVLGFGGTVIGIVSMNDIVRAVGQRNAVHGGAVITTLQSICERHHPAPRVAAA